ncbi:hypothetical protein HRbin33_01752 [bacterium HR33]|nr:hypothetical protein HRbin33_01752 [bacterium HR33]
MTSGSMGTTNRPGGGTERSRFWRTFIKVMLVQAASLLLLWLLQARYSG